jgi:hypothetical protein
MTKHPAPVKSGASSREVAAPAENKAISGLRAMASAAVTTLYFLLLNFSSRPIDFSEATGIKSVMEVRGIYFPSSSTLIITLPTSPVAPTNAIFILNQNYLYNN